MGDWVNRWRLDITRDWSWPGPSQLTLYLGTVADLRAALLRVRADPAAVRWRYRRDRTWVGAEPVYPCRCMHMPALCGELACRCGVLHRAYRDPCGLATDPPLGPACAQLFEPSIDR